MTIRTLLLVVAYLALILGLGLTTRHHPHNLFYDGGR